MEHERTGALTAVEEEWAWCADRAIHHSEMQQDHTHLVPHASHTYPECSHPLSAPRAGLTPKCHTAEDESPGQKPFCSFPSAMPVPASCSAALPCFRNLTSLAFSITRSCRSMLEHSGKCLAAHCVDSVFIGFKIGWERRPARCQSKLAESPQNIHRSVALRKPCL